ncbi:ribosome maturation factor RimP [Actinomadura roseirufa]|uniref:ribosome maturation factor RimP n=1 Tax=Actinomadura roseirufa TaxID=2094049 RepID=UPI001040EF90|nr:ribosome maturation factor RimP [Actinomadura roseirufa]
MSVESRGGRAQRGRDDAPARPTREAAVAELTRLLAPAVAAAGFELEEVDVRPAGRRRLVKIVVDGDGGVGLDDIARLSETASGLLDGADVMGASPYVLEVTSPGVDRPLTEPRHWRRAAGRLVVAPLAEGGQVEGRVVSADDEAVVIDVAVPRRGKGSGGRAAAPRVERRSFGLAELGRGRVQVEFKAPAAETRAEDPAETPAGAAAETGDGGAEETRSPAEPD